MASTDTPSFQRGERIDTPRGPGRVVGRHVERRRQGYRKVWLLVELDGQEGVVFMPPESARREQLRLVEPDDAA